MDITSHDTLDMDREPTGKNLVAELKIDDIRPAPDQPRTQVDSKELEELTESISQVGLMHPITVRQLNKGYELIAGQRRLMAMKGLGATTIAALIIETTTVQAAFLTLIENVQRVNLDAMDLAKFLHRRRKADNLKQRELAKHLGKSESYVSQLLELVDLPERIEAIYRSNKARSPRIISTLKKLHDLDPNLAGLDKQEQIYRSDAETALNDAMRRGAMKDAGLRVTATTVPVMDDAEQDNIVRDVEAWYGKQNTDLMKQAFANQIAVIERILEKDIPGHDKVLMVIRALGETKKRLKAK